MYFALISGHHHDLLIGHFEIDKTQELIARKYYWSILRYNVKICIKGCNICLASKASCYKPYGDLQLLPVSKKTSQWTLQ